MAILMSAIMTTGYKHLENTLKNDIKIDPKNDLRSGIFDLPMTKLLQNSRFKVDTFYLQKWQK